MATLPGYLYRKSITISRSSGSVTNYQMKLLVGESSGATGENVDCGGHCSSDFKDIRFTKSDGTTLLSYWIESITGTTPNQLATVWIKFDFVGITATTFYMYYGNSSAVTASSGTDTFILFDDFADLTNWDNGLCCTENSNLFAASFSAADGYNDPTVSGGNLVLGGTRTATDTITVDGSSGGWIGRSIKSKNGISDSNFRIRAKQKVASESSTGTYVDNYAAMCLSVGADKDNNIFGMMASTGAATKSVYVARELGGTNTNNGGTSCTYSDDTWYVNEFLFVNNGTCSFSFNSGATVGTMSVGTTLSTRKVAVGFAHRAPSATITHNTDWLFVGKYETTEPAWGSWGNEEGLGTLAGYSYRRKVTLSRASGAVTNYQMKLLVGESSGAVGETINCGGYCKNDFTDLRFTTIDGTTLLNYWIESISGTTPNQLATIWIKFDSIGTTATTFYMYYGNSSATSVSNAANTFVFFDHFDSGSEPNVDNWYHFADNGSETVAGSIFTITGHASYNAWGCKQQYGTNYSFRMRVKVPGDGSTGTDSGVGIDDRSLNGTYIGSGYDQARLNCGISENWTTSREGANYSPARTDLITDYTIVDISRNGSTNVKFSYNDSVKLTSSTNVPLDNTGFFFYSDHASQLIYVDWVAVRKYEETEPAWGTWLEPESLTVPSAISKVMGLSTTGFSKFMGVVKASIKKIGSRTYTSPGVYGIWNPNDKGANITVSNKNLSASGSGLWYAVRTTLSKTTGKWYCEMIPGASNNGEYCIFGVVGADASLATYVGNNNYGWGWWGKAAQPTYYHNSSGTNVIYSFTTNDVVMIALDIDNHKIWFGKNGTWNGSPAGDPAAGTNAQYSDLDLGLYYFAASMQSNANVIINCGQIPFSYTPPSGFLAFSGDPSWFNSYSMDGSWTYGTSGSSMNFRMIYAGSDLKMSGSKIRLTIKAHNSAPQTLEGVSIGERSGSTIGMVSTPTRVTFDGGSSSVTLQANVDKVSDEIDFEIDETKQYLIHVFHNEGNSCDYAYAYQGGRYYKVTTSDETMEQSPSSYNTSQITGYTGFISKIEIYSVVPTTYTTWNPNDKGSELTLSDKNNVATKSGSGSSFANSGIRSTIGKSSGKWYWEYVYTEDSGSNWPLVGVGNLSANMSDHVGSDTNGWGVYAADGNKYYNDTGSSYGTSFTQGDIIGVALNMDTGKVWFSKNGTWMNSGDPVAGTNEAFSGLTGTIYAFIVIYQPGSIWTAKFGATALSYVAPSGYKSGLYS